MKHSQNIDSFLNEKLADIWVMAETFGLKQLQDESFLQEKLPILQKRHRGAFVDLGFGNGEGMQVAYAGAFKLGRANYAEADWFKEAVQRNHFISDVFLGIRGLPHFIVAVKKEWQGKIWILRSSIDFVAFNTLVENIRIGRTGLAFIVNGKGEFQTNRPQAAELDIGHYVALMNNNNTSTVTEAGLQSGGKALVLKKRNGEKRVLWAWEQRFASAS